MLLTVAIPTYNAGSNLLRAVRSCLAVNVSRDEFEVLIIDNGSDDGSLESLESLAKELPLRIVRNPENVGRVGNWNRCIELAKGKYLLYVFANDELAQDSDVKGALEFMQQHALGLLVAPYWVKHDAGKTLTDRGIFRARTLASSDYLQDTVARFSFMLGPVQANIYDVKVLRDNAITFPEDLPINGDQYVPIKLLKATPLVGFWPTPQALWNIEGGRFHFKLTLGTTVKEDLKLMERLEREGIHFNKARYISGAFLVLVRAMLQRKATSFNASDGLATLGWLARQYWYLLPVVLTFSCFWLLKGVVKQLMRVWYQRQRTQQPSS